MTPLVMLPGMLCDQRLFSAQVEVLSEERSVIVMSVGERVTMSRLANAVIEAAPPKFALAGLSLGGIVAMEVVRQAPERVERLALLDTNPLAEPPDVGLNRMRQIESVKTVTWWRWSETN